MGRLVALALGAAGLALGAPFILASAEPTRETAAAALTPPRALPAEPSTSTREPVRAEVTRPAAPRPVLWITGDILLSDLIRDLSSAFPDPADGFAAQLAPVSAIWNADPEAFVIANLEVPVPEHRRNEYISDPRGPRLQRVRLMGEPYILPGLRRAGVDALTLANNHALDQEREGLAETVDGALRAGLIPIGAGRAPDVHWPVVVGEGERSVQILTFYASPTRGRPDEGEAGIALLQDDAAAHVAAAARDHHVVVILHFVGELVSEPKPRWRRWVRELVEAGAGAVVGHGTHVPMPVEIMEHEGRRVPVAWGIGNLISDMGQRAGPTVPYRQWPSRLEEDAPKNDQPSVREELLVRLELEDDGTFSLEAVAAWLNHDRYLRWNRHLRRGGEWGRLPQVSVLPLRACGAAAALPPWPEPGRQIMLDWLDLRRRHIHTISGLVPRDCARDPFRLHLPSATPRVGLE